MALFERLRQPVHSTMGRFRKQQSLLQHKQFYRGNKYSYEDKNADLIPFIQMALGYGYDEFGEFDNGVTRLSDPQL